jgi:hypothetical protein
MNRARSDDAGGVTPQKEIQKHETKTTLCNDGQLSNS